MKKKIIAPAKIPPLTQIKKFEPMPAIEGLPINFNIPTHHADIVNVLFSSEGLTLISFFSRTPGVNVEECRVSFTQELEKKIVDLFCKHLNYYPQGPTQQVDK